MYELAKKRLKLEFYKKYIIYWENELENYKKNKEEIIIELENDNRFKNIIPITQLKIL